VCVVIYYIHAQIVTQMNKLGQALCGSLDSFGRVSFHVPVCVCVIALLVVPVMIDLIAHCWWCS